MKNKKGFTLIELLAVIVILAIIALIATPIILNMIENAKKGAAKDSAYGYIEAIDFQNSMSGIDNEKYKMVGPGENLDVTTLDVKVKGSKPTSGKVTINSSGIVTSATLTFNGYIVTYDGQKAIVGDKQESETEDKEEILKGSKIYDISKTLVYKDGVCKTDGTTYEYMGGCYIKGASTNNYVWYNGFMWRIMGINSDNTVRLITIDSVTALPYGPAQTGLSYKTNEGYINTWLNEYFYNNLNDTKNIIKNGIYFCSQSTNETGLSEYRKTCNEGSELEAKVGLISYDEYLLAGGSSSIFYTNQNFWTMTPYSSSTVWSINNNGNTYYNTNTNFSRGVRPVINVKDDSIITSGDGTTSNYYILAEDKEKNYSNKKIVDTVSSGEYVILEGKTYRVVSKENEGVKLILDGFYNQKKSFGNNNTFTETSGIGLTLNTEVLEWIGDSDKIIKTTWYQGDGSGSAFKYKEILESKTNPVTAKVGLIKVGEMLSSQSSTILTNNYQQNSNYSNTNGYWTLNKSSESNSLVFYVEQYGSVSNGYFSTNTDGVRPVIVVRNDLSILGGNGTWNNPYQI